MGRSLQGLVLLFLCATNAHGDWMKAQADKSLVYLENNISASGAAQGSVIASPAQGEPGQPDYFYHWVRDAALVMNTIVDKYQEAADPSRKKHFEKALKDYIVFSKQNQNMPNPSDSKSSGRLGEPKFNADGGAFNKGWGRPQNDGPGLRAIALIRLANLWLDAGRENEVRSALYDGKFPSDSVIKADLEFVAEHWKKTSFDIWEEISGQHFYTRIVHRRAMVEGAALAERLGDTGAAAYYRAQVAPLEAAVASHWNSGLGLIQPTFDRDEGIYYKHSEIDTAVLLAVLHASGADGYFGAADDRVLSTMEKQIARFQSLYTVNGKGYGATAMGRYPEDVYDGLTTSGLGNPWFLTTAAVAEMHYRIARDIAARGSYTRNSLNSVFLDAVGAPSQRSFTGNAKSDLVRLIHARGDAFLSRACFHGYADGRLAEQINRETGFMQGARDLTWSYASYLTAYAQR